VREKGFLGDREKAMEADYFRKENEKLLEKLRQGAKLDDIAKALADKLRVDNQELLGRVRALGVTPEAAPALFLTPLVQVAWAEGSVGNPEREAVLRIARQRDVAEDSPAYAQLVEWLKVRPSDTLFDVGLELIKYGFAVLPPNEREERIGRLIDSCHEVAAASGTELARLLGLGDGVSRVEAHMLDEFNVRLRRRD
jgi:hypothetical protein